MDAFASPAVALLCELEDAAVAIGTPLAVTFTDEARMRIEPRAVLTPPRVARIREHRDALAILVKLVLDDDHGRAR